MWILKTHKNDLHSVVLCRKLWLSDPYHAKSPGAQNQLLSLSGKLGNSNLLLCKAFNTCCKTSKKKKWISLGWRGILASVACWIEQQKEAWNQKEGRKYFSSIFSVFNKKGEKGSGWCCFSDWNILYMLCSPESWGGGWPVFMELGKLQPHPLVWAACMTCCSSWGQACASSPSAYLQIVTVGRLLSHKIIKVGKDV